MTRGDDSVGLGGNARCTATTAQATRADPALPASLVGVMMGVAVAIAPTNSGKLLILVSGDCTDSVISDGAAMQIRYGTGTAPLNGAALVGTAAGSVVKSNDAAAAGNSPFHLNAIVSGLAISVAAWVDICLPAFPAGKSNVFVCSGSTV